MSTSVKAAFEIAGWDEVPFDEARGVAKLTRASVKKTYTGDITGTSATEWLMAYEPDQSAIFVGIERIKGTVAGKKGSLVLQHVGAFKDGAAKAELTILSGTGALKGSAGTGTLLADPKGSVSLSLG